MQEIESATPPTRELGHEHGVDFAPLSQRHHLAPLGAIELRARGGFFKHADHLVAGARRESDQIALLPGARLIGGRNSAIKECIRISGVPGRVGEEAVIWSDEARSEAVSSEG
jgi:hypothetical protein